MVFEGGRPRDQGQIMNWDLVLVLQLVHDIPVYMAPATQRAVRTLLPHLCHFFLPDPAAEHAWRTVPSYFFHPSG